MKRLIQITLIICLLFSTLGFAGAAPAANVSIDGVPVEFTQETGFPFVDQNNRTQVPFRVTLEAFGAEVDWDSASRTAIAEKDGVTVKVPIGTNYVYRDDLKIINDTASLIQDNLTYLPIRIVLEAFGADVGWDAASRTVTVKSDGETISLAILAAEVDAAMEEITSMDSEIVTDMSMEVMGEKMDMKQVVKSSLFVDPLRMKSVQTVTAAGETMTIESYMIQQGDDIVMYIDMGMGEGFIELLRMPVDEFDYIAELNLPLASMITSLDAPESAVLDGVPVIKLEGVIPKELMDEVMSAMNMDDLVASMGMEGLEIDLAFADIPMTMWVDPESKLVLKYEMDMKDLLTAMFNAMLGGLAEELGEEVEITVNSALMVMTMSNFNNATEFTLPAGIPK